MLRFQAVLPVARLLVSAAAGFAWAIMAGIVAALAAGLLRSLRVMCLPVWL